jgi:1,4-dihydroxy-2-naphthoyl-CoA synthase
MERLDTMTYEVTERIARITLDRPERGNGITLALPEELQHCVNQTVMAQGLHATQILGTIFDGIARHTPEGHAFVGRAATAGFKQAVRERDQPFGDAGPSTFKG